MKPGVELQQIERIIEGARRQNRSVLLETEGMDLIQAMGIAVPERRFVSSSSQVATLLASQPLSGDRVVVKVISPKILHKSDVGGVKIVKNDVKLVTDTIALMERKFTGDAVAGYTINEFIAYDQAIGSELLFGIRWTADFGPVVTFGAGGIYTEFLAKNFRPGSEIAVFSPVLRDRECITNALQALAVHPVVTGSFRGQKPRATVEELVAIVEKFLELASALVPAGITEFEINPLVATDKGLVALDALTKLGTESQPEAGRRPTHKIKNLLEPKSAAIIGVSEKMNPGHIILNNLIRDGFAKERIYVVKPGSATIEGCRCVADIRSLPEKVDLLVLAIAAAQVPEAVTEVIEHRKAESVIVIPGGLEEKKGSDAVVARMQTALTQARKSDWEGPVINGGNCLGIRSRPGRYDTMFIPQYKIGTSEGHGVSPVATVSQSGAFAISRANKLAWINPKYSISIGNQTDLTVGDYLEYLERDAEIQVFAVYLEGFKQLDGAKFLASARRITASGRTVILYRAGRTAEGAQASASHTASIAGDYSVTRALCDSAGVVVADSLADFDDLTKLFALLRKKTLGNGRLGAISNAGFECVATADNLGKLKLSQFTEPTMNALGTIFRQSNIDGIVDVHNPLDLTPMANDEAYEKVTQAVLDDSNVDIAVVACVPLTPALQTLAKASHHREDATGPGSVAERLIRLNQKSPKPVIAVVDAGTIYDPMAVFLEESGIPTFRTVDRALRLIEQFVSCRSL